MESLPGCRFRMIIHLTAPMQGGGKCGFGLAQAPRNGLFHPIHGKDAIEVRVRTVTGGIWLDPHGAGSHGQIVTV